MTSPAPSPQAGGPAAAAALAALDPADQDLILRLVLARGNLKEVAASYGVSYPTLRSRLDRLVRRLQELLQGRRPDPMADLLADLLREGQLSPSAARRIRDLHRERLEAMRGPGA